MVTGNQPIEGYSSPYQGPLHPNQVWYSIRFEYGDRYPYPRVESAEEFLRIYPSGTAERGSGEWEFQRTLTPEGELGPQSVLHFVENRRSEYTGWWRNRQLAFLSTAPCTLEEYRATSHGYSVTDEYRALLQRCCFAAGVHCYSGEPPTVLHIGAEGAKASRDVQDVVANAAAFYANTLSL
ncbi:MAG: hypothetical protein HY543_12125, partial [Deltaproteobacteria bacterium]|nr:hypothetical protein [Deltaproteobacteria bacterium]